MWRTGEVSAAAAGAAGFLDGPLGFPPQSGSTFAAEVPIREVVSQISPPIRILLVLAVAVLGVYMLVLRPKPEEVPPVEPAGTSVSEPGKVRDAAEDAVDAANGQLAQQESVDGVDAGEAAAGSATKKESAQGKGAAAGEPAEDLKGLPKPVRKAIRQDKVLVLLFSNGKSADDLAVQAALKKVDRRDGRVFVHTAPLKRISRYGRIARGVSVEQSPSVVVADRNLLADTLVGYVDRTTINQAVTDALRNTNGLFTSSYLRAVDKVCTQNANHFYSIPNYYLTSPRKLDRRIAAVTASYADLAQAFAAVKAPKRWTAFHKAALADLNAVAAAGRTFSATVTPKSSAATVVGAINTFNAKVLPLEKRSDKRFDGKGLLRCGSQHSI